MSFAFTPDDVATLQLEQKIAVMDSLMVAVIADGQAVESETEQFDREVEAIEWGMTRADLMSHLVKARARVMGLSGGDEAVELFRAVAARITDAGLREKVFRAMGAIMFADGDMASAELSVLKGYATIFELTQVRYELIKADIIAAAA